MTEIYNVWDDEELERDEYEFLPLDNIGTPAFFRVKDWKKYEELTFRNKQGNPFTRNYLHTSGGLLPISSVRLRRQLKKFADDNEKRELTIQRWCEGSDTRSTIFKVELHKGVVAVKKGSPKKSSPKTK